MEDEKLRAAYRATLVAALKEAQERGDKPAEQRIRTMIEQHDKQTPAKKAGAKDPQKKKSGA